MDAKTRRSTKELTQNTGFDQIREAVCICVRAMTEIEVERMMSDAYRPPTATTAARHNCRTAWVRAKLLHALSLQSYRQIARNASPGCGRGGGRHCSCASTVRKRNERHTDEMIKNVAKLASVNRQRGKKIDDNTI